MNKIYRYCTCLIASGLITMLAMSIEPASSYESFAIGMVAGLVCVCINVGILELLDKGDE